jgi:hypothetical protein
MLPSEPTGHAWRVPLYGLTDLWSLMHSFEASYFLGLVQHLTGVQSAIAEAPRNAGLSDGLRTDLLPMVEDIQRRCADSEFFSTADAADRIVFLLRQSDSQARGVSELMADLLRRLEDESKRCVLMRIPSTHAARYQSPLAGWDLALAKFPSIQLEVEEASKCFSLGRYTATVFHLMRVLEKAKHHIGPAWVGWSPNRHREYA